MPGGTRAGIKEGRADENALRILLLSLAGTVLVCALLELLLFLPKAEALQGAAQTWETRGTLATVDMTSRTVTEY